MKVLSIIVPTYNVESYLGRCLDSLIVYRDDLEVLVIIDGSKDNSQKIAKIYQNKYPSIFKVVEKENGHYGSCVNVGLSLAKGKYVKVLDADDYFDSSFSEYLSYLTKIEADVVFTDYVAVNEEGIQTEKMTHPLTPNIVTPISALLTNGVEMTRHYEITYRKELLIEMQYTQTEGISYTDLEWSSLPFGYASTFIYYPMTLYHYLKGRSGQTVDIEYRKKNMWMENKVVLGLARKYEVEKNDIKPENEILLRTLFSSLIRQVYFHYLINFRGMLQESELRTFDDELKDVSERLYSSVVDTIDVRKYGSFRYIKDYRDRGTINKLKYLYYDACKSIGAILSKH